MAEALNNQQRKELLEQVFNYQEMYLEIAKNGGNLGPITEEIEKLMNQYGDNLQVMPLSRCPFTGDIVKMPIDTVGIDGLWWNYDAPKRPRSDLPKTFFAFDGAMHLNAQPESFPFLCSPGPELPFVIPRLLSYVQVKGVMSSILIGKHIGLIIMYYADPSLEEIERINDWGTGRYWDGIHTFNNTLTPGNYIEGSVNELDYDFDLEPWVKSGKLLWIEPGDQTLTLKSLVKTCPYLSLEGKTNIQYIQFGEVWSDDWAEDEGDEVDEENEALSFKEFLEILEEAERR